jgi:hypothetical protein
VKVPRFRIARMMAFVGIVALDFGAIRALLGFGSATGKALLLGALPMANVLLGGILIGRRHPGYRPFLRGFVASGATALALYIFLSFFRDAAALENCLRPLDGLFNRITWNAPSFDTELTAAFVMAAWFGWPQLLFALIGGSLSRRFEGTSAHR